MKAFYRFSLGMIIFMLTSNLFADNDPYSIEVERVMMPGTPAIHSFAFAKSNGKWLFIGGRTNGLHGFDAPSAFPTQYSNKNIFVVNPATNETFSRSLYMDCPLTVADPLRSTNMQFVQVDNKLYMSGGYGFDSTKNDFVTFPVLTIIDVEGIIQAVINGNSVLPYIQQLTDSRVKICGGSMDKIGDHFYLIGGHDFNGRYMPKFNDQVYSDQIRKFRISETGSSVSITDYSAETDTNEYHRRDMNVVQAISPGSMEEYLILYGGVFRHGVDLPYLNPIYIKNSGITIDNTFDQKLSQYTCAYLSAFNNDNGSMHTTFFGGMSVYFYNEITQMLQYDSLVPFINEITTLTKHSDGTSDERISATRLPALLGTNAEFILNDEVPHFDNGVIKLNELSGRTFAGYIYGGIRALLPNNTPSFPSDYIMKVYITPKSVSVNPVSSVIPDKYMLMQNYPNPFNPSTKIRFDLPSSGNTKLTVYDGIGRLVSTIVNSKLQAGHYEVAFDGSLLSNGIYFYKLETDSYVGTKKMVLLK